MSGKPRPGLHAVILAGGAGERFWPASRRHYPKPFLRVVGGSTLLDATLARARRFAKRENVWIVCGREHARAIREASGLPPSRVLVEPQRRNTAMAVAWAALRIHADDPSAVMAVLSADHHIPDERAFAESIRSAADAADGAGVLVTLGVRPTRPDTGYGYIQVGKPAKAPYQGLNHVRRFVEKPNEARAARYVERGDHLWNAGVFIWSVATLLSEVKVCAPKLARALAPLRRQPKGRNSKAVAAAYEAAPSLPIDVAVMEVSDRVWTVPVEFAWSDVGTWSSLAEQLGVGQPSDEERGAQREARHGLGSRRRGQSDTARTRGPKRGRRGDASGDLDGNRTLAGDVILEGSCSNLIWGGKRLIALVGVEGLAVVDTDDVILITKLDQSSDVRRVVAALKEAGRDKLT